MIALSQTVSHSRITPHFVSIDGRVRFAYSRTTREKFLSDAYISQGIQYEPVYQLSVQVQLLLLGIYTVMPHCNYNVSLLIADNFGRFYWSDGELLTNKLHRSNLRGNKSPNILVEEWLETNRMLGIMRPSTKCFRFFGNISNLIKVLPFPESKDGLVFGKVAFESLERFDISFNFVENFKKEQLSGVAD